MASSEEDYNHITRCFPTEYSRIGLFKRAAEAICAMELALRRGKREGLTPAVLRDAAIWLSMCLDLSPAAARAFYNARDWTTSDAAPALGADVATL